jgi:radical SAM protein with 4Fe4S-binding SPASM domain
LAQDLGIDSVVFRKMEVSDYNRSVAFPEGSIESKEKKTPSACLSGWFNLVLRPEGNVSACGEVHRMPIGDSNQLTLKELWLSQQMMNIRLLGKYGQLQKLYEACQSCPFYKENIDWMKSS